MATPYLPDDQWVLAYDEQIHAHARGFPILELGCGRGRDTRHLLGMGEVVALDLAFPRLIECRHRAPMAVLVQADLSDGLPFPSATFGMVLASLSIHYFTWQTTLAVLDEIRRVMAHKALLILRVNSTRDQNYGAVGYPQVEENLYAVGNEIKRFFDGPSLVELFKGWHIETMAEREILRYEKQKWVWELSLYAA